MFGSLVSRCRTAPARKNKWSEPGVFLTFDFGVFFAPHRRALFEHLNFKSGPGSGAFHILKWHVLRATARCTFWRAQRPKVVRTCGASNVLTAKCASRFSTSTSAPELRSLVHVHFETCFTPQLHAPFLTAQRPKGVRTRGAFNMLTSKCASRHRCVQFLISYPTRKLRTCRFSDPISLHSEATK